MSFAAGLVLQTGWPLSVHLPAHCAPRPRSHVSKLSKSCFCPENPRFPTVIKPPRQTTTTTSPPELGSVRASFGRLFHLQRKALSEPVAREKSRSARLRPHRGVPAGSRNPGAAARALGPASRAPGGPRRAQPRLPPPRGLPPRPPPPAPASGPPGGSACCRPPAPCRASSAALPGRSPRAGGEHSAAAGRASNSGAAPEAPGAASLLGGRAGERAPGDLGTEQSEPAAEALARTHPRSATVPTLILEGREGGKEGGGRGGRGKGGRENPAPGGEPCLRPSPPAPCRDAPPAARPPARVGSSRGRRSPLRPGLARTPGRGEGKVLEGRGAGSCRRGGQSGVAARSPGIASPPCPPPPLLQ